MLGMVPFGCSEEDVSAYLANWLLREFIPPDEKSVVAVARVVPDHNTSSWGFVNQVARSFERVTKQEIALDKTEESSVAFEALVYGLREREFHPVLIIERFHSFASVPDSALLSLLSAMRTLEHLGVLTTIALSPTTYDALRRSASSSLPFVNSAYGDNHDRAIMSPLSSVDFCINAEMRGVSAYRASELYRLGGGPDVVYRTLLDEVTVDDADLVPRCVNKVEGAIRRFTHYAVGKIDEQVGLLTRLLGQCSTPSDIAYIRSLPQRDFFAREGKDGLVCYGEVLRACVLRQLDSVSRPTLLEEPSRASDLKILIISANSLSSPLDLEDELRSMITELERTAHRSRIRVSHCQAARPDDIVVALRRVSPHVIHFSGHGNEFGVELRSNTGGPSLVMGPALANALQGRSVKVAIFNVCLSKGYAAEVAKNVDVVVATSAEVSDEAAKQFSIAFYRTLADGFTVGEAFKDAMDSIVLRSLDDVFELTGNADMRLVG